MSKNAAAFAAGMAQGYVGARTRAYYDEREEEDRALRRKGVDLQQQEQELRLGAARQQQDDQLALRRAAAPVRMEEIATKPETMDNRDVGAAGEVALSPEAWKVGDQRYTDRTQADAALTAANTPGARTQRVVQALDGMGRQGEAIALQSSQEKLAAERAARLRTIQQEGYADTMRAMMVGDPDAVAAAFNRQGSMKIEGPLQVKPREIEVPGYGKVQSFDYTGTLVRADGTKQQGTINSHQFAMSMLPYKDQLEVMRKGTDTDSRVQARQAQADVAAQRAEAYATLAEARATRGGGGSGGGGADSEDRKRWTSLQTEAGRRLDDANKTLRGLQSNQLFMLNARKPGSPEAQQLADLQADVKRYSEDRDLFTSMLGGKALSDARAARDAGKGGGEPGGPAAPAGGKGGAKGSTPAIAQPQSKAEYDALPPGTRYRHPSGDVRIKGGAPTK